MLRPDRRAAALALASMVAAFVPAGCSRRETQPPPPIHYVVGPPWQGDDGVWFYPVEHSQGAFTGYAVGMDRPARTPTADGERSDPNVPSAGLQRLQLPVIVRVTNLDNGRQVALRANDRGPAAAGRVIGLNAAARALLGMTGDTAAPVSIEIDAARSQALADTLHGGPHLDIATAPLGDVAQAPLPPPGAGASSPPATPAPGHDAGQGSASPASPVMGSALAPVSRVVILVAVAPHAPFLDAGTFSGREAADAVAAAIGGVARSDDEGRHPTYQVTRGPFASLAAADAALDQARKAGISGVRIVVE